MGRISQFKALLFGTAILAASSTAQAASISFQFSNANRAANAAFDVVGGNLEVTLTNTSTFDTLVPVDVLTALYFDIAGNPALTKSSAVLGSGSGVIYASPGTTNMGGEWAYRSGISSGVLPDNQAYGISSTGMNVFGPGDLFGGSNLAGPLSPDGLQYGIVSASDITATGNGGVTGSGGLIKNSVVFTLSSLPMNFSLDSISNIRFQYGTALSEPSFPGTKVNLPPAPPSVPEPSSVVLMAMGLVGLAGYGWRKRKNRAA